MNKKIILSFVLLFMIGGVDSVLAIDNSPNYWSSFKKSLKDSQFSQKRKVISPQILEEILLKNVILSDTERLKVKKLRTKETQELHLQSILNKLHNPKTGNTYVGERLRSGRGQYLRQYGRIENNEE